MSKREIYEQKAESLITPLILEHQFELVDIEYIKEAGTWYLRIYLDKEGGITIDDCETISRAYSELVDEDDFIEEAYILEVSSPGLGRPLKKEKDFKRSIGEEVEVRTYKAVDKQKEFIGILKAYDGDTVTLSFDEEDMVFQRSDIALIRLAFDF
ncbi:MAG TPA: ribosome maturation factor RimP [Candidatus Merdenecus merdavium]|nr:ribosome maturation factor RimP [Candidatus Merdenecus merdavium]